MRTDFTIFRGCLVIKGQGSEAPLQSADQGQVCGSPVRRAVMCTVKQLSQHDGVQGDLGGIHLEESLYQLGVAPSQVGDPGVRVEQIGHGSSSRTSYSPCSGRSSSPCHAPAVDKTNCCHSSCSALVGFLGPVSLMVTSTSPSAAAAPMGTFNRNTPSAPTRE